MSATLLSYPSPFSPCRTAPHRTRRTAAAHTDGMAGPPSWRARRARARTRDPLQGVLRGGVTPFTPAGDAKGEEATTGGRPRRHPRKILQWEPRPPILAPASLRCFDRAPITQGRASCASQSPLGVFPFSCERRRGGRGEWRRERRSRAPCRHRRAATRGRLWSRGAGPDAAREEDARTEAGRLKQSKEPGAAANDHTAPSSPSSPRRLHLCPAVRTVASPFSCVVPISCTLA
jgi:hypothetical protein